MQSVPNYCGAGDGINDSMSGWDSGLDTNSIRPLAWHTSDAMVSHQAVLWRINRGSIASLRGLAL